MVALSNYSGREQSYVKHVFLESYLERLAHKVASFYNHIVYVDGFAGPWQSVGEQFEDTSFGIALNALRRAKSSWQEQGKNIGMSAFLVERDGDAYRKLAGISQHFPEISIRTYQDNFIDVITKILSLIADQAFAFFLVDPKGWRLPLKALAPMLSRDHSEVVFNFMFDFINRAASIRDRAIIVGLNELIPYGDWRRELEAANSEQERKYILTKAFADNLRIIGKYKYVAETTILRPIHDRPLYCLFYATRHRKGIEVFRDCQFKALHEQSAVRSRTKVEYSQEQTSQSEMFKSLHDMAPNVLRAELAKERAGAAATLLNLTPRQPEFIRYDDLWPLVLARHIVRRPEVNSIAADLRKEQRLVFPDWEAGRRVPQGHYRVQRA